MTAILLYLISLGTEVLHGLSALFDGLIKLTWSLVIAGNFNVHVDGSDSPTTNAPIRVLDEYSMIQHCQLRQNQGRSYNRLIHSERP